MQAEIFLPLLISKVQKVSKAYKVKEVLMVPLVKTALLDLKENQLMKFG